MPTNTALSDEIWVKVIAMLQQNWCILEKTDDDVALHFFDDHKTIFDTITYSTQDRARAALIKNGFMPISEASIIAGQVSNDQPFSEDPDHPQKDIYSSGEYWTEPSDGDPSIYKSKIEENNQRSHGNNTSNQTISKPMHFEVNNRAEALERWKRMSEQEQKEAIADFRKKLDRIQEERKLARRNRILNE